jgi:hypothetical protein
MADGNMADGIMAIMKRGAFTWQEKKQERGEGPGPFSYQPALWGF